MSSKIIDFCCTRVFNYIGVTLAWCTSPCASIPSLHSEHATQTKRSCDMHVTSRTSYERLIWLCDH